MDFPPSFSSPVSTADDDDEMTVAGLAAALGIRQGAGQGRRIWSGLREGSVVVGRSLPKKRTGLLVGRFLTVLKISSNVRQGFHPPLELPGSQSCFESVCEPVLCLFPFRAFGIVSYFERLQDLQSFSWSESEVMGKLFRIVEGAFTHTTALARMGKISMRAAALTLGIKRVSEAKKLRGLFP